jgi:hypothetical protein
MVIAILAIICPN